MLRVRPIRLPQLGHNCFELRLSPSMVEIVTSKADDAVMAVPVDRVFGRDAIPREVRSS
jgi:hypothetical protein